MYKKAAKYSGNRPYAYPQDAKSQAGTYKYIADGFSEAGSKNRKYQNFKKRGTRGKLNAYYN